MSHQFQTAWPSSHVRPESTTTSEIHEEIPDILTMDELQQGELYLVKSKLVVIALFQGKSRSKQINHRLCKQPILILSLRLER